VRVRRESGVGLLLTAVLVALCSGCAAGSSGSVSPAGLQGQILHWVKTELYFGMTRRGGGVVSDEEWKAFLAQAVTSRFPDGLTVYDASGQWRGGDGVLVREQTRVVVIVHEKSSGRDKAIREIIALYKKQFDQESVLRVDQPATAEF